MKAKKDFYRITLPLVGEVVLPYRTHHGDGSFVSRFSVVDWGHRIQITVPWGGDNRTIQFFPAWRRGETKEK